MSVTANERGRAASGGRGSGRRTGVTFVAFTRSISRAMVTKRVPRAKDRRCFVLSQKGEKPLQPARRNRRSAFALAGAAEDDPRGGHCLDEVVGGKTDPPFGRRQAELAAHGARQPWIGSRAGRPDALVESAENEQLGRLQPRFERPPDMDAGVGADRPLDRDVRHQRREQVGILTRCDPECLPLIAGQACEQLRQRLTVGRRPEAVVTLCLAGGGREDLAEGAAQGGDRDLAGTERGLQRSKAFGEIAGKGGSKVPLPVGHSPPGARHVGHAFLGDTCPSFGERRPERSDAAGHPPAAEQGKLEEARRPTALGAAHAEGGQRMLEEGEQLQRVGVRGHCLDQEPREDAGGRPVERLAGRIVDGQLPAVELDRNPAGKRPVGRHQRDRAGAGLERFADGDGDRQRLPPAHAGRRPGRCRRERPRRRAAASGPPELRPVVGGLGGAKRFGEDRGARTYGATRRAQPPDVLPHDTQRRDELLEAELRMAEGRPIRFGIADRRPARLVEALVQAGQYRPPHPAIAQ